MYGAVRNSDLLVPMGPELDEELRPDEVDRRRVVPEGEGLELGGGGEDVDVVLLLHLVRDLREPRLRPGDAERRHGEEGGDEDGAVHSNSDCTIIPGSITGTPLPV